jgi:DNA invertase Pin-like site-specific DNA recombinase
LLGENLVASRFGECVPLLFGALAEFERSLIRERTQAGLAAARRACKRNIEMTPLCNIEVTLPRVLGPGRCAVAVVSMSKQEFSRLEVLLRVQSGRLRVSGRPGRVRTRIAPGPYRRRSRTRKSARVKLGRKPKLSPHRRREAIRRRDELGETLADIARTFNVSCSTISHLAA